MQGFTTPFGTINPFVGFPTYGQQWQPYATQSWQQPIGGIPFGGIPTGNFNPYYANTYPGAYTGNSCCGVPGYTTGNGFATRSWPTNNFGYPVTTPMNGFFNTTPIGYTNPGMFNTTIPSWFNGYSPINNWTNPINSFFGGFPANHGFATQPFNYGSFGGPSPSWINGFNPINMFNGVNTPTPWGGLNSPLFANTTIPFGHAPYFGQQFVGGQVPTTPFNFFGPATNWSNTVNPFGGFIPTPGITGGVNPFGFGGPFGFQPPFQGVNPFFAGPSMFSGQPIPQAYPFGVDRDGMPVTSGISPNGSPTMQSHMSHREAA